MREQPLTCRSRITALYSSDPSLLGYGGQVSRYGRTGPALQVGTDAGDGPNVTHLCKRVKGQRSSCIEGLQRPNRQNEGLEAKDDGG